MSAARVSYFALMGRELGLPKRPRNSVLDPHMVPSNEDEGVKLEALIMQPGCLVKINNLSGVDQKNLEAHLRELHSFERAPRIDFSELGKKTELWHCCKRIMNIGSNGLGPFTRKQIIAGIRLRGEEVKKQDPDYVERETDLLDWALRSKTRKIYIKIREIELK